MKAQLLTLTLAMTFAASAHAKSSATTITGTKALAEIASSPLDPKNDYEGDDCAVEVKQRGHDLEITFKKNGHEVTSLEIFEDTQYKFVDQSKGDDGKFTLSTLNGEVSLTVETASDAFYDVSATVKGVSSECEVDM